MKRFTSRDLNGKRSLIKRALEQDGSCIIEWKPGNRETEIEAILIKKELFDERVSERRKVFINKS